MAITPADIQAQTFSEAKRGYDPAEVDVFLEQLASEVDAMLNKIVDLKTRLLTEYLKDKKFGVINISKSGTTTETALAENTALALRYARMA